MSTSGKLALAQTNGKLALALVAGLVGACSDDDGGSVPIGSIDAGLDAGRDASEGGLLDATSPDASSPDAGLSAECTDAPLAYPIARGQGASFAASIASNRVHLAYLVAGCGVSSADTAARGLRYVSFGTAGTASDAQDIANTDPVYCAQTREPALQVDGSGAPQAFFGSDHAGALTLWHAASGAPWSLTMLSEPPGIPAALAAFALADLAPQVIYRLGDGSDAAAPLYRAQLGKAPVELLPAATGHHPRRVAASALPVSGAASGAVAWVNELAPSPGVYYRLLNGFGEGQGEVVQVSDAIGAYSDVDLASAASRAAIAYTVSRDGGPHALRFRRFQPGLGFGPELALTSENQDVAEFALAAYAGGYALAYRRRPNADQGTLGIIQLLFLDASGNTAGSRFVADASAGEGIELLAALDGRLIVVWTDTPASAASANDLTLRVARLTCL